ncbi:hypothetical protein V1511DRAFT_511721 [Dipodascopsis uninucleata]
MTSIAAPVIIKNPEEIPELAQPIKKSTGKDTPRSEEVPLEKPSSKAELSEDTEEPTSEQDESTVSEDGATSEQEQSYSRKEAPKKPSISFVELTEPSDDECDTKKAELKETTGEKQDGKAENPAEKTELKTKDSKRGLETNDNAEEIGIKTTKAEPKVVNKKQKVDDEKESQSKDRETHLSSNTIESILNNVKSIAES